MYTSLVNREIQDNTTTRNHYMSTEIVKIKKTNSYQVLARLCSNWSVHMVLVGIY
jgi:bisphosphoglycerate-independent phosphoglycerate mutase (AlkP superfamily)